MQTLRLFTIAGALTLCLGGCMKPPTPEEEVPKPKQELIIPVEAVLPERGAISSYIETHTRVEAERRVEIHSEGVGECKAIFAEEGDTVKAGQILAELDKSEAAASLSQAEVQSRQQKSDFERSKNLFSEGLIAQSDYDTARFTYEQGLENLSMQKVRLSQLTIKSPIDGVVTSRDVQPGTLVSSGTPVFTVVDPSSFTLTIQVPEKELHRLEQGQLARVNIDAFPDREFDATLRRINPSIDPTNGTVKVLLDFKPEDQQFLRQSAFARVLLVMETRDDALLVPKDAVIEENARKFVYTVVEDERPPKTEPAPAAETPGATAVTSKEDEGSGLFAKKEAEAAAEDVKEEPKEPKGPRLVAKRVEIQVGLEDSHRIEITGGITPETLVIVNGQITVKEGSKINVTNGTAELFEKAGLSAKDALQAANAKGEEAPTPSGGRRRGGF